MNVFRGLVPWNYGSMMDHEGGAFRDWDWWNRDLAWAWFVTNGSDDLLLWPVKRYQMEGN